MLVSAAACAPANCALNKTSPGTVSFFIDHFFFYENNSLTRINQKVKITSHEKTGYTVRMYVQYTCVTYGDHISYIFAHRLIKKLLQQLLTDNILLQAMDYVTKPVSLLLL